MTAQSRESLSKFGVKISCGIFVLSILLYGLGLNFLKSDVFTHYYNPSKHVIVQQNPDTKEIYSWKDSEDNIYTASDSQVSNFSWGTTMLLMIIMVIGALAYNMAINSYTKVLLNREPRMRQTMPRIQ
jgi:Ca2+/H+ antiporter